MQGSSMSLKWWYQDHIWEEGVNGSIGGVEGEVE